jgi:hypothetical protein
MGENIKAQEKFEIIINKMNELFDKNRSVCIENSGDLKGIQILISKIDNGKYSISFLDCNGNINSSSGCGKGHVYFEVNDNLMTEISTRLLNHFVTLSNSYINDFYNQGDYSLELKINNTDDTDNQKQYSFIKIELIHYAIEQFRKIYQNVSSNVRASSNKSRGLIIAEIKERLGKLDNKKLLKVVECFDIDSIIRLIMSGVQYVDLNGFQKELNKICDDKEEQVKTKKTY